MIIITRRFYLLQFTLFWEITTITQVSSWPWTKWICSKTVRELRTYVNNEYYASRLFVLYDCPTRVFDLKAYFVLFSKFIISYIIYYVDFSSQSLPDALYDP